MADSEKLPKFEFIVSTPSHNAMTEKNTKQLVRKHVMRPFKKRRSHPKAVILQDEGLKEYLAKRQSGLDEDVNRENEIASTFLTKSYVTPQSMGLEFGRLHSPGSPFSAAALLGASRPNPFGRYPIEMTTTENDLVHHIWASRQVAFQPFRDYWFFLGMLDPAAMHLVIANAAMHRNVLRGGTEDDLVDLRHSGAALASINQRIRNAGHNITDEILGAVLAITCHEFIALRFEQCVNHFKGFQTMLALRGGLATVESATYVRLTLFWVEHNLAAAQDIPARSPPPYHLIKDVYSPVHKSLGLRHLEKALQFSGISLHLSSKMLEILEELSLLTVALTAEHPHRVSWEEDNFPGFGFYPTLHKLLAIQMSPAGNEVRDAVQEIVRLGALLLLAEVRRKFGVSPVLTSVLVRKLQLVLGTNGVLWDEQFDNVRTWVIIMAWCAADTKDDRTWVVEALLKSANSSNSQSWNNLVEEISKMWWIDEIFLGKSFGLQLEYMKLLSQRSTHREADENEFGMFQS